MKLPPGTPDIVAVLMGGPSSEREVSIQSGRNIAALLRSAGVDAREVVVAPDSTFELPEGTTRAFIALHGAFGEDGQIQRILEQRRIPHTGNRPHACARAFDKVASKNRLIAADIPTAPCAFFRNHLAPSETPVPHIPAPLPLVVKPARQGSSVGVTVVRDEAAWPDAIRAAFALGDTILAETYIPGRELTVSIVNGEALPILEIFAPGGNYDYHAKYTPGASHHAPADLPPDLAEAIRKTALRAARALDCLALGRVDIRLRPDGAFFVLELNNIPGFTATSLLPDAARAAGWSPEETCLRILSAAR